MGQTERCPSPRHSASDLHQRQEKSPTGIHPLQRSSAVTQCPDDKSIEENQVFRTLEDVQEEKVSKLFSKPGRGCVQASPTLSVTQFVLICIMCNFLLFYCNMSMYDSVVNVTLTLAAHKMYLVTSIAHLSSLTLMLTLVVPTKGRVLRETFSSNQLTQVLSTDDDHYLVFDQVGLMASTTTYMHVMLPINFTAVLDQIQITNNTINEKFPKLDLYKDFSYYEKNILVAQTKMNLAALTRRLNIAKSKIETLNRILPQVIQKTNRFERSTSSEFPYPTEQHSDQFLHFDHPHLTRHKRWLLQLLQGVVGTFMGLYTNYQIKSIANKVQNIEITQNLLIHLTRQHTLQLEKLNNITGTIYHTLNRFMAINPQVVYIGFNEVITLIEEGVTRLVNIVQQLQHRRLAVDWLTQHQLDALHRTVLAYTDERNYALLTSHPSDYFQLELSYLRNEDGVVALLHIPCTTTPDLMTIMRYIPFPIPLATSTHHSPYTVEQSLTTQPETMFHPLNATLSKREALYLVAEAELIAIDGDSRFRLLTQSDFAACIQRNHIYLCDKQQILGTNLQSTCLGSLYQKDPDGVRSNCKFERRPLREEVFQMTANEFLVFSPKPYVSRVHCGNGTSFTAEFGQTTRLIIPNSCAIELKSHILRVEENIQIPLPASISSWRWDPLSLPADLLDNLPHLDSALFNISHALNNLTLSNLQQDHSTMDKIHDLTQRLSIVQNSTYPDFVSDKIEHHLIHSGSRMSVILWIGFILSLLGLLAGLLFTYRQCIMAKVLKTYTDSLIHVRRSYHPDSALPTTDAPDEQELESIHPVFYHHPPKPKPRQ